MRNTQIAKVANNLISPQSKGNPLEERNEIKINRKRMWNDFKSHFQELTGKEFVENEQTLKNISILFYYFLGEEGAFLKHDNLVKIKGYKPSLEKGLMIIGGFGVGKTDMMRALEKTLKNYSHLRFTVFNVNGVVADYEECKNPLDKKAFFDKYKNGVRCFDDIKTERLANNFGKVNIFKDLLEERYFAGMKTHVTCNYKDGLEGDPIRAIEEFGEIYGGRVHDRLYEMFNFIELPGKSMRG